MGRKETIRVLYIDGVGPFGGASRSLFEVIRPLTENGIEAYFLGVRGTATDFYSQVAKKIIRLPGLCRFDNTQYSHYRGVRWLVLLRELYHIPFTVIGLLWARLSWKTIDIIHVNEITEIFPGLLAKFLFCAPLIIHVRSPQWANQRSYRTRFLSFLLKKHAKTIIAINENTRLTLSNTIKIDIIQNSFTPKIAAQPDARIVDCLNELDSATFKVGFVGNLHHSKGLFDLLEAARIVLKAGDPVDFVIVGGVTKRDVGAKAWLLKKFGLAQDVGAELTEKIRAYELDGHFHLLGATNDIQSVYERLNVICFPSHFDAPGRPVFEAAFSAVPSIVCVENPRPDTLVDHETGLAIPAKNPEKLSEAIRFFVNNRDEAIRMGKNAKILAEEHFNPITNSTKLRDIYIRLLSPI